MEEKQLDRNLYDVVTIKNQGQKSTNHIRRADIMSAMDKPTGQFVRIFSDMFLKKEAVGRSYV